ncbi:MAG: phosphate ABC transporter permease PstA [Pseudomonadota bacterium]|jgi:phosphate transport system permease protein|nr:phosphate ABC transporter permease PstA [Pseudomonadota bacterium]
MNTLAPVRSTHHIRLSRRLASLSGWTFTGACLIVLSVLMVWILEVVFVRGVGALKLSVLTTITQGNGGGLLNAIEGTLVLSGGALLLAVPFGVAAGIYSAEYRFSRWAVAIRFLADVLVGVPSIVVGYFGYVGMVEWLGWSFSVAAGSIALAIISLPYICRTTELALRQVSNDLRDAAYSLGADDRRVILGVCLPAAMPGILTGILLALAVSVGETAPLLYTAGWSNYLWDGHLTHSPIGYLTYAIWTFINEPFAAANALAYAAALLVTGFVLIINILARVVLDRRARQH